MLIKMRKHLKTKTGSTLIWALVAALVLSLIIVVILSVTSTSLRQTSWSQVNTQAYYTAQSVNDRIVAWLSGIPALSDASPTEETAEQYAFLADLESGKITMNYTEQQLGAKMGKATTTVEYTSDDFNEIKITTTAEYADAKETLSTTLKAKLVQAFTSINTNFDYGDQKISNVLEEVKQVDSWVTAMNAASIGAYGFNVSGTNWWSYFYAHADNMLRLPATGSPFAYLTRMDSLYVNQNDNNANMHDYNYRYLRNTSAFSDLKVFLDISKGSFAVSSSGTERTPFVPNPGGGDPDVTGLGGYPYNAEGKKGNVIMVSNVGGGNVAHNKMTYYTVEQGGEQTDVTFTCYLGSGITPGQLTYQNMYLYMTDSSENTLYMTGGTGFTNGALYTKRNAILGGEFYDSKQSSANRTNIQNFTRNNDLTFGTCSLVFADPGVNEEQRHSVMQGNGGTGKTIMSGGTILIQNNHELTIKDGAVINATENKGIAIESGGRLVVEAGAIINGNIFVSQGGYITIKGGTINGNIYCGGDMAIEGSFELNPPTVENEDNHGYVNDHGGVFIYNDSSVGIGTLHIEGTPAISGLGKIHTFSPYPSITGDAAEHLFCNDRDDDNECAHWRGTSYAWQAEVGSTVRE